MQPDIIGTIYKNDGIYDDEGATIKAPTKIPGFHVNFIQDVPEIAQFKLDPQPSTPHRVYAGVLPVCYVFESEDQFRSFFPEPEEG